MRLRLRACYGYEYGRAMGTDTGVLRVRIRACYGYGCATITDTGMDTGIRAGIDVFFLCDYGTYRTYFVVCTHRNSTP